MNAFRSFFMPGAAFAVAMLLGSSPAFAQGVGDITCDTPELVGTVMVVASTPDPADDIALVKIKDDVPLPLGKSDGGGLEELAECVVGPVPMELLQTVGSGPAYVEHGLTAIARWQGFMLDVDVVDNTAPIDVAVVAVDFDRAEALAEQFVLRIERSAGGAAALVVLRSDAGIGEVARLPLSTGRQAVTLGWPTAANPGTSFVVGTGGTTVAVPIAADSRPIAVRVGYLGLNDAPTPGDGQVSLIDPAFVAE